MTGFTPTIILCIHQFKTSPSPQARLPNFILLDQNNSGIKKCNPTGNKTEAPNELFDDQGTHISDNKRIANTFCNYFTRIGTSIKQHYVTLTEKPWKSHIYLKFQDLVNPHRCVFKFKEVTVWDILSTIKSLRSSTASGYDNIPISFINDGAQELSTPLMTLINLCLRH